MLLVDHGSYLIVHKGWWIGQSTEVPEDPHGYFQISILDTGLQHFCPVPYCIAVADRRATWPCQLPVTDGRVRYGAPLTTGKPFRLRSVSLSSLWLVLGLSWSSLAFP